MMANMVEETTEQKLKRHEDALSLCIAEIEKLRAENEQLRSAEGAHDVLRRIYLNEAESSNARIKAAQASINYEKSRLENAPPVLEITAKPVEDLATLVHRRRRRQAALEGRQLGDPEFEKWVEREDGTYPADDDTPNG
jgi:hypothetical protein